MPLHSILQPCCARHEPARACLVSIIQLLNLANAVFWYPYACLEHQRISSPFYNPIQSTAFTHPSYSEPTITLYSSRGQPHPPNISPSLSTPVRRRTSIPNVTLWSRSSCCYRRPLSAALTADDIAQEGMPLLMILARMRGVVLQ